ncbi:MAG: histidinol dehydrogenase, partial [Alphaproteobacteria bacterium]
MPVRLDTRDADFFERLEQALAGRGESRAGVEDEVRSILTRVRDEGDQALLEFSRRFDCLDVERVGDLRVAGDEMARAWEETPAELRTALERAVGRIHDYHVRQIPEDRRWRDEAGVMLGWRWTPIEALGIYVPGGLASYPSSVLMNVVPARVA